MGVRSPRGERTPAVLRIAPGYGAVSFACSAAKMALGDIGRRVIRTPIALEIALAIAANGGIIGTSPTPRTPKGCRGFGTSTMTVSIMGTSTVVGMR